MVSMLSAGTSRMLSCWRGSGVFMACVLPFCFCGRLQHSILDGLLGGVVCRASIFALLRDGPRVRTHSHAFLRDSPHICRIHAKTYRLPGNTTRISTHYGDYRAKEGSNHFIRVGNLANARALSHSCGLSRKNNNRITRHQRHHIQLRSMSNRRRKASRRPKATRNATDKTHPSHEAAIAPRTRRRTPRQAGENWEAYIAADP